MAIDIRVWIALQLCVLAATVRWLWSRRHLYRLSWQLNGDWSLPLIGHVHKFIDQEEILVTFRAMFARNPSPMSVWLGTKMYVMLDHPDDVATVLGSPHCVEKAEIYRLVSSRLQTDGLVSNQGAVWRKHRKLISQGFSESVVTGYMDRFNKHIGDLVTDIDGRCGTGEFNLKLVANVYMMNTILDTTLGHDLDEEDKHTYEKFFSDGQNIISKLVYQPWHQIDLFWRFTKWPKLLTGFNVLHNRIFDKLIAERLVQGCDRLTLIDKLLRIMEEDASDINVTEIKSECNTIMMAGSDTSALTYATTCLFLAMYPEHQQRIHDEVDRVCGGQRRPLTRAEVDELPLTEAFVREVMRITPIVPIIARRNLKPMQLRGGVVVPVNTSIGVSINDVHRNRDYWGDDADDFRPDRMSAERLRDQHPYAFLGFSAGPRNCIGYKYAIVIVKLAVARTVHNFRLATKLKLADIRYSVDINIRYLIKHMVEAERR